MAVFGENRKARFDFEILEKFQGGLVLQGSEVKSIRLGRIQLAGSFVGLKKGELWLIGSTIPPYQPNNTPSFYNQKRDRKLLVQKRELATLIGKIKERGLTLVPLSVYSTAAGRMKLEFAVGRSKKKWDKRDMLKKRETEREIQRVMRG